LFCFRPQSFSVATINEEHRSTDTSDDDDFKEAASEDETSLHRPVAHSSNGNASSIPFVS
jgi:hypothetical protein